MRKQHPTGPLSLPRPAHSACSRLAWAHHSRPHHWVLKIVFIWMPKWGEENTAQEESTHQLGTSIFLKNTKIPPKGAGSAGCDETGLS